MSGLLEFFERDDAERIVQPMRKLRADPRQALQKPLRLDFALEAIQQREPARVDEFGDRRRQSFPDAFDRP